MRRTIVPTFVFVCLLCLQSSSVAHARGGPTLITTCGYTIAAAGHYQIAANLQCEGDAVTIQASDVTLSLDGHVIQADRRGHGHSASGNGIVVGPVTGRSKNINIEGPGFISQFMDGVVLQNVDDTSVIGVVLTGNTGNGINVDCCAGQTVKHLRLASNVLTFNGLYGVNLTNSTDGVVEHNEVIFNGGSADLVNTNTGGVLVSGGTRNEVTGNAIEANINHGLWLLSPQTQVSTNHVNGTTLTDGGWTNGSGIGVSSNDNRIHDNTVDGDSQGGILVDDGITGNDVTDNTALGNSSDDLIDNNLACVNSWRHNTSSTHTTCIE